MLLRTARKRLVTPPMRPSGFTLLEMVVVLGIFAMLSLLSSQIVNKVINNFGVLNERGGRLADVQRAMGILQRDVMQMSGRSVRDTLGDPLPAVLLSASGELSFTRAGWQNPLQRPRSTQQRVAYRVADDTLYRAYWPVLDQAPDSEPFVQKLLTGVSSVEFLAVDGANNERTFWPPLDSGAGASRLAPPNPTDDENTDGNGSALPVADPASTLAAVLIKLEVEPFGEFERIWVVPQWP